MAYTESEEDSIAYGRELLSLCPKGYALLVGDCDEGVSCDGCQVPDAPINNCPYDFDSCGSHCPNWILSSPKNLCKLSKKPSQVTHEERRSKV